MLTQVACNQLHLRSFVRVFFFTFIALFSNGYKYHTNLDDIIHLSQARFSVKKYLHQLTIIGEESPKTVVHLLSWKFQVS